MYQEKSLTFLTLFNYAITAFPLAMLGLPLYIYLPTFYTQYTSVSMTMVGLILFISRVTDVITDPLIGLYNDQFQSKFGKRKPFMFVGAIILTVSFYALIHPSNNYTSLWLLGFSILVYFGWSMISIPYLAWSAEISSDNYEKTRLSGARELFTIIGGMSAIIIPYLYGASEDAKLSLEILYFSFFIAILILLPMTLKGLNESSNQHTNHNYFHEVKSLWKSIPSLKKLQFAFLLNALANALPATLFLFFVELVLEAPQMTGALLLLYFLSGIVGLPFWTMLSHKIGKTKSWQLSMLLASFVFIFVPFLEAKDLLYFAMITFISGLSLGADMALPASIQADIIQREKSNHAGLLFGIWAMLTKFSLALGVGLSFILLGAVEFQAEAPTPLALTTLSLLYGASPVLFKMLSIWLIQSYEEQLT